MLFSHSFWNKAFPVATSTGSRRVVFLLYVYVCPWIPLSALAFGSVSFRPPSPLSLGLARLDQPSPPAHQDTHTHTHSETRARCGLEGPYQKTCPGNWQGGERTRERPCPRTVLAWPAERKGGGAWYGYGWRGRGDSLARVEVEERCRGGVCPAFSGLGHGVVRIKIGQRRPFRLRAAGSKRRLRVMASPAFFRPMDGPLAIGVEVRLGLVIKRGEGLIQWTTQIHRRSLIRQC